MKEPEILIAGTFNNDLESGRRMQWLLEEFKPDLIVGEVNQLLDMKASTREMVWAVLFDEYEIPVDVQEKWKAIQTHKEHLAVYDYSTSKKNILYFMLDDEALNARDVALYAQTDLVEEMKKGSTPEEIREWVRKEVDSKFYKYQEVQNGKPYCKKYYEDRFLCKRGKPFYADDRGEMLAQRFQTIMKDYSGARIFGFFQGTQIVKPNSVWATQALGRPMHNIRHYLGEEGIKYGQLVDLI